MGDIRLGERQETSRQVDQYRWFVDQIVVVGMGAYMGSDKQARKKDAKEAQKCEERMRKEHEKALEI